MVDVMMKKKTYEKYKLFSTYSVVSCIMKMEIAK